jgi:hypothetical protein
VFIYLGWIELLRFVLFVFIYLGWIELLRFVLFVFIYLGWIELLRFVSFVFIYLGWIELLRFVLFVFIYLGWTDPSLGASMRRAHSRPLGPKVTRVRRAWIDANAAEKAERRGRTRCVQVHLPVATPPRALASSHAPVPSAAHVVA